MRKFLSLLMVGILFISFNSELSAQWGKKNQTPLEYPENYDKENYLLKYEEVVEVSGQSKDELYDKLRRFIALNYNSANNVIQLDDKESGNIIVKGLLSYDINWRGVSPYSSPHTLDIKVKDERYKYKITCYGMESYDSTIGYWEDTFRGFDSRSKRDKNNMLLRHIIGHDNSYQSLILSIKASVLLESLDEDNDDW
jgi:hypothetical protein